MQPVTVNLDKHSRVLTIQIRLYESILYTRSVQKVSRISAGYVHYVTVHYVCIFDFRFFVALCWYSCLSLMPTSSAILNVQFLTAALLARVLARLRFLPIPKNGSKNLYQILCEKQN